MASSTGVNVPTNTSIKEKDVNNKLQLYGIYRAFANGKVPSNKQIDVAMNSTLANKSLTHPSKKLSTEGQKLVGDLRDVIEQAKVLLLTKNQGNLLQDFIWQTQQISGGNASTPNAPLDKDTAKEHGNQALDGLRTLGTLILSNGQFRKLLSDASVLLRDMAGDAAQKAADKVNPSEDELSQIDKPAEDNTWHEVPSVDGLKSQAKGKWQEQKPFSRADAQQALGDATQAAHPSGSRDPADAAHLAAKDQKHDTNSGVDAAGGARAGASNLKETARQNVPQETQDQAKEYKNRTANYLKEKMPEERRDQTIYRLKKMIVEIQGHQDYQQAIDTLLDLAEEYSGHTKNIAGQSKETVKGAHTDNSLQLAETDLKTLLERFANSTSMDDFIESIDVIYRDADRDPELKNWFKSMNRYIRKCLKEQGFVLQDAATDEWNKLYDHGNYLLRDKYRDHTDRIVDEAKYFGEQFDKDPMNKKFATSVNKLFTDLGQDENGQTTFKPHLIKDLTDVIIPGIFESIRYVPIPRIEYSDPMIDAVVENLVLEGDNLAPNVMEFGSDNYWRWGRKSIASKNKNKVMLSVSGVQCDLRDVSYYVKKKQGFPGITDKGIMDIFLGGTGLSFKVAMETADKSDNQHFFKINTVSVDVKNMKIKFKKSNHKLLFGLFTPIAIKTIRPVIQKVIEKQIRDNVHQLDGMLYSIKKEADRAAEAARRNPDPENIQNIYQRYASAANKKFMEGKQKKERAQEKMADKKVNVAVTQHDSIFKNIALPGGISTKATEYKELAAKGDKWESPIFSIGSAKETSSLPKIAAVQRKSRHGPSSGSTTGGAGYGTSAGATGGNTNYHGTSNTAGTTGTVPTSNYAGGQGYSGQGYDGQQGYSGQGYAGQGYDGQYDGVNSTSHTAGTTGTGAGFGNEVDSAFNTAQQMKPVNGTHGTLLGANNPVFTGSA